MTVYDILAEFDTNGLQTRTKTRDWLADRLFTLEREWAFKLRKAEQDASIEADTNRLKLEQIQRILGYPQGPRG